MRKPLLFGAVCVVLLISLGAGLYYLSGLLRSREEIEVNGAVITVRAGGNLQAAIDRARAGDTIVVEAGASFTGSFVLPKKVGNEFITIQSSARATQPGDGIRVTAADAATMPKLLSPGKDAAVIRTEPGAHHYRFVGIEFSVSRPEDMVWSLITIGDDVQSSREQVPHHIVFDRCYVHAHPKQTGAVRTALAINGSDIEILNSLVSDIRLKDNEAHAISSWNGPGPYRIINNRLESTGVSVLFGGATANKGMNPSGLEFRRNYVTRPLEWRGKFMVKNLFEFKDMRNAVVEENVFENNWASGQDGTAVLMTPASRESGPDARVENVIFRSNIVRRTANGVSMTGTDYGDVNYPKIPVQNRNLRFENNWFTEVSKKWSEGGSGGRFLLLTSGPGPDSLVFDHNTVDHDGTFINLDGGPMNGFTFTNNTGFHNEYGVIAGGDLGSGIGSAVLGRYAPRLTFRRNLIVGAASGRYPSDNFYPSTAPPPAFLAGKATDGKALGADLNALREMEKKVVSGRP